MIHLSKLNNGTHILLEQVKTTETVSVGFWLLSGSRDEDITEKGYSHFLEHMLFKGTSRRNALKIAKDVDRVGGILNAYTNKEVCCYYCTVPREHLELALDILDDMVFHSILDIKEIENEKNVVINEILSILDSPEELAHEHYFKEFWKDHPLARSITGTVDDIKKITQDNLFKFYRERYVPCNFVISIVGNFDENHIRGLVGLIAGMPFLEMNNNQKRIKPERNPGLKFINSHFNQVQVYTGLEWPGLKETRDFYTSLVFSTLFGESMSSRLFQHIREELGLCYTVNSFRSFFSDTALFTIYANTKAETALKLIESLNDEFTRLFNQPVTEAEVEDAKSHLAGSLILASEDMEIRMKRIFKLYMIFDKILDFDESIKLIKEVAVEDVNGLINAMIRPDHFNLLAFGRLQEKKFKNFRFSF